MATTFFRLFAFLVLAAIPAEAYAIRVICFHNHTRQKLDFEVESKTFPAVFLRVPENSDFCQQIDDHSPEQYRVQLQSPREPQCDLRVYPNSIVFISDAKGKLKCDYRMGMTPFGKTSLKDSFWDRDFVLKMVNQTSTPLWISLYQVGWFLRPDEILKAFCVNANSSPDVVIGGNVRQSGGIVSSVRVEGKSGANCGGRTLFDTGLDYKYTFQERADRGDRWARLIATTNSSGFFMYEDR